MAKIDLKNIAGYDDMTPEEKIAALLDYEIETPDVDKLKSSVSKANAEAADYKRKLRDKMSEAEAAEAQRAEQEAAMKAELETLRKEKTISGYKAKYLELGYDADLALDTAQAMADGDTEKVFANQKTFIDLQKKSLEIEKLDKQPDLTAGKLADKKTAEQKEMDELRRYAGL